jgi:2-haloacid dehalogenase
MPLVALTFDVYGTVVDWRGSILRAAETLTSPAARRVDWPRLADAWRRRYQPTLARVNAGELSWQPFDQLQRLMLDEVLGEVGATDVPDDERARLASVWAAMDAWPDAKPGLARLKRSLIVSALSNGSIRQLVDIARHAGLPWDLVLSVELFGAYKPDPRVYQGAVDLLQCAPDEVMMVATHTYDLRAAQAVGMKTAFVARPREWGPDGTAEPIGDDHFDLVVADFEELARQLGS